MNAIAPAETEVSPVSAALTKATSALLSEIASEGHWVGSLSSSALSTATAVVALTTVDRAESSARYRALREGGLQWLIANQNADGGWGDTECSKSNISTTALVWAALSGADGSERFSEAIARADTWLQRTAAKGSLSHQALPEGDAKAQLSPDALRQVIADRYGEDRTFSVPILMHLAICGRTGWDVVMPLPFELAALPHQLFGALQLPVVSYALPALIAIGQAIHHRQPSPNPIVRGVRNAVKARTLCVLESIQPENGGFLEATPLTSFVTMALASAGLADHPVARKGAKFLADSVRDDGSWAIDTNLATWVTTLAVKALSHQPGVLSPEQRTTLREWLLGQQYKMEHPYTHAAPGGWAWTNLPGGVPDADDTPGALLALLSLSLIDAETLRAGELGVKWLLDLQNRDGGIPTFCRGWGALPFDRSSPDLTAHTLRAWTAWLPHLSKKAQVRVMKAIARGIEYLSAAQRADGAWLPLWFGNEHAPDDENPIYGTAKVVIALRELEHRGFPAASPLRAPSEAFLVERQNEDGSWSGAKGAPSSIEETALALEALAGTSQVGAVNRGANWLAARVQDGKWLKPSPIGFYFAKLWYYERLYPIIWTVGALGRVAALERQFAAQSNGTAPAAGGTSNT
jgi:squalene-hopene/tetraprenyl-beta-curcumene cyclase